MVRTAAGRRCSQLLSRSGAAELQHTDPTGEKRMNYWLRTLGLASLAAAALTLTGCGVTWTFRIECPAGGSIKDCRIIGEIRPKSSFNWDFSDFDASNLYASVSGSDVSFVSSSGSVTATLLDAYGSSIDAEVFSWYRSGSQILLSNPSAVTSWVQQNGPSAEDLNFTWTNLMVEEHTGSNTMVVEVFYDSDLQGGDSHSWYVNPNGDGPPQQQQ